MNEATYSCKFGLTRSSSERNLNPNPTGLVKMSKILSSTILMTLLSVVLPFSSMAEVPASKATPETQTETGSKQLEEAYTLGVGDRIKIDVFNVPEYSGENQVLVDGSLVLPIAGIINVQGMTLKQATDAISLQYASLLKLPVVTVRLLAPRPIKIGISGEVSRPGAYSVQLQADTGIQFPTVTKAIKLAGGITQSADIRQVKVQRPKRSGADQVITLDLWSLLKTGSLNQDIMLRDGDTVFIPTATAINLTESPQLAVASFSPDIIKVNIVGEVTKPGTVELLPNTPLNQALLAAGGFANRRANTGEVELIRLNPNGSVSQRSVSIDFAKGINDQSNPALRNNDVIVVNRSGMASFNDTVGTALSPIGAVFPFFNILRYFGF